MRIISIGEVLWDIFDDRRRFLGGAPLNFSINSTRLGHSVMLVSAVGNDSLGLEALTRIRGAGLSSSSIQVSSEFPTSTAEIRTDSAGKTLFSISRPAAFDDLTFDSNYLKFVLREQPDWIYYGTLAMTEPRLEQALIQIFENAPEAKRFYDVNLREGHWNLGLVERLSAFANVIKLNIDEAEILFKRTFVNKTFSLEEFCRDWSSRFRIPIICVTLGSEGCAIFSEGNFVHFGGLTVEVEDTVGAGDAFSAGFLHGLGARWALESASQFANALGAVVASRPGATPEWTLTDCRVLLGSCRGEVPLDAQTGMREQGSQRNSE